MIATTIPPSLRAPGHAHPTPVISMRGVSRSFGAVHAVRMTDLDIDGGTMVALLGPNGAGKSTTVSMLLGLTTPDCGRIEICGQPPATAVRNGRIAAMLQTAGLMPGVTVAELLGLGSRAYPHPLPAGEAMDLAGLTPLARRRVDKLSGGQAQRVRFALVAVGNPDILLLDEPTTAMDVAGRQDFWTAMREYAAIGHTVVFATHYLDEVTENADRVVVMVAGRVAADGTPESIRALSGASVIRFATAAGDDQLPVLPGSTGVDVHGSQVTVHTTEPDAAVRALAASSFPWRDLAVAPATLENSFLKLTREGDEL